MKYTLVELDENSSKDDIKEVANCMMRIQKHNERDFYIGKFQYMGFEGFKLPSQEEYKTFVENATWERDAKIYMARETCCDKSVVGIAVGGLTRAEKAANYRSCGRLLFFWVDSNYRKTTMTNGLYKKLWGWFADMNCISVSITFKNFQNKLTEYFMSKGYTVNNVEVVGPVRFLEETA